MIRIKILRLPVASVNLPQIKARTRLTTEVRDENIPICETLPPSANKNNGIKVPDAAIDAANGTKMTNHKSDFALFVMIKHPVINQIYIIDPFMRYYVLKIYKRALK